MSYRCEACQRHVPHKAPCLRHQVLRDRPEGKAPAGSILREIKVCGRCKRRLDGGRTLGDLIEEAREAERLRSLPQLPEPESVEVAPSPLEVGKVILGG